MLGIVICEYRYFSFHTQSAILSKCDLEYYEAEFQSPSLEHKQRHVPVSGGH